MTITPVHPRVAPRPEQRPDGRGLSFVWLEITGRCQLECVHCYADSGPSGTHGAMTAADWRRVIDQAADLGVAMVQFIGGEPTLHPDLPGLVRYAHALAAGLQVEVFSNLVHVTDQLWEVFGLAGVRLACSYYSTDPATHAAITGRPSHARTRANITRAIERGIPLRVGVIDLGDSQDVPAAVTELEELGVRQIGVDRLRGVGRGTRTTGGCMDQLCGQCGDGKIAIGPDGTVWPCVFSRWMPVGNALAAPLAQILDSPAATVTKDRLRAHFAAARPCVPQMCNPQCGPACSPACRPMSNCRPVGACVPNQY